MNRLRKLYASFTRAEIRYLKGILTALHHKGDNKALELVRLMEKDPDSGNREMAKKLYGDPRSKAFSMLKSRVFDLMLEVPTLSINLRNNAEIKEDPEAFQPILVQKLILQANFLKRRGQQELALELFEKADKLSEEYGLQGERLSALISMQNMSRSESDFYESLSPRIEDAREKYLTDMMAINFFDKYRLKRSSRSSVPEEEIDFLHKSIGELEKRLINFPSPRATYYCNSLKFDLAFHLKDYESCRKMLKNLDQIFRQYPGLGSAYRLAVPYIKLAVIETNTHNYEEGFRAGKEAQELLNPKRFNYLVAVLYKTYASIYLQRWEEALKDLASLGWFEENYKGLEVGIAKYLESCIYYFQKEYALAYQVLMDASKLMVDKEGWNVGIRIFEIILMIEMDKPDLIEGKLESLRKHLSRYEEVEERMSVIYRILLILVRKNYDFIQTQTEVEKELLLISKNYPWVPIGHEVIRFDAWFSDKLKGIGQGL